MKGVVGSTNVWGDTKPSDDSCKITVPSGYGECTNSGRQVAVANNFLRWGGLISVDRQYGTSFTSPIWRLEF